MKISFFVQLVSVTMLFKLDEELIGYEFTHKSVTVGLDILRDLNEHRYSLFSIVEE